MRACTYTQLPYDPLILLAIYPKDRKLGYHTLYIHNKQDMKSIKMSISGWMDRTNVLYKPGRILFSHKKSEIYTLSVPHVKLKSRGANKRMWKWNSLLSSNTDRTRDHYVTWNKPGTERLHAFVYLCKLKSSVTEVESRMFPRGWRWWVEGKQKEGDLHV